MGFFLPIDYQSFGKAENLRIPTSWDDPWGQAQPLESELRRDVTPAHSHDDGVIGSMVRINGL